MWRLRDLARDAARSLGWAHLALFVALLAIVTTASLVTVLAATSALDQELQVRRAGADVWIIEADQGELLPAATCAGLAYARGVVSAGGIYPNGLGELSAFPGGHPLPVNYVTPGFARVYAPELPEGRIVVGRELADRGVVGLGAPLFDAGGEAVARTEVLAPDWVPVAALGAGVVVPATSAQGLSQCMLRTEPGNGDVGADLLRATFGSELRVSEHQPRSESLAGPWEQWQQSAALPPGLAAGVAAAFLVAILQWFRRGEFALRRAFGSTISAIGASALLEAVCLGVPAAALAMTGINGWLLFHSPIDVQVGGLVVATVGAAIALFIAAYGAIACGYAALRPVAVLADR